MLIFNLQFKPVKNILLLLVLALMSTFGCLQILKTIDSTRFKQRKAIWDVRIFKLDKQNRKEFRKQLFELISDYFKPKLINIKNQYLINDSTYVKTYREAAFNKIKHKQREIYYAVGTVVVTFGLIFLALMYNF